MQVHLTHQSHTRKSIEMVIPATEISAEFGAVLSKIAPKVRIPGFRPGKAPRTVLMERFGGDIRREVAENLVKRLFWDAAAAAGTAPISQPAVERAELEDGAEGRIHTIFDVAPEVALGDYKHLQLTKRKRVLDDELIQEQLEQLRQASAKFVPVEDAAAEGQFATLDIKVKPQGMKAQSFKDQVIELKAERPFDAQILGLRLDEKRSFVLDVPVEDPNRAMAGKRVTYDVVLKDLRSRNVPELNDEFAKDHDQDSLEALTAKVRADLDEALERDALTRLQSTMLETLLDSATFEAPSSLVALQLDDYCNEFAQTLHRQGINPRRVNWAVYRQSRLNDAERAVKSGYLLQAIGNAEEIEVSDEEIDTEIRALMAEHNVQQPFEAFKAGLEQRGGTTEIRGRVRTEKIFTRLMETATVTTETLDKTTYESLVELERRREAGIPVSRFDAGGLEGGELEDQEGGEPAVVAPAEVEEGTSEEAKPKRAKKTAAPEEAAPETEDEAKPKAKRTKKAEA